MGFTAKEIMEYAKSKGINLKSKTKKTNELIHAMQLAEGNVDCFGRIVDCRVGDCKWRAECQN